MMSLQMVVFRKTIRCRKNRIPQPKPSSLQLFPQPLTETAVQRRIEALVGIFRTADVKERIKSSTEEQYDRMKIFLTNISNLIKDIEDAAAESA
ncbi:hypothetical protein BV898_19076 [Hypsibius exemplaris]|uniref:Uncharacterized protein n=1 Tax=Hypsibius exemplaris TaxID=2072580 RepID=A0A9X6NIW5_HYPEX|nr:hypothetical protein BV898_19076 [Hypsibius exemplaris]